MEKEPLNIPDSELEELESDYPESSADQSKIIELFSGKNSENNEISDAERSDFLRKLALKEFRKEDVLRQITMAETENDQSQQIQASNELHKNPSYRIFLNILLSRNPEYDFSPSIIRSFLEKYPEPYDFEELIDKVKEILPEEQVKDVEKHGRALAQILYGDKENYWEQLKLMESEAKFIFKDEISENEGKYSIKILEKSEADELLYRIEIHGDPWQGNELTAKYLYEQGLEPHFRIEIEGKNIWFSSNPYDLGRNGRLAIVGYFESGNKLIARSFYQSNSQGVWRYLPKYMNRGNKIAWFHKGFDEQSISLPIPIQRALSEINSSDSIKVEDPEFVFAGTARDMFDPREQNQNITYVAEVSEDPIKLEGNFYSKNDNKMSPEHMDFKNKESEPDFNKIEMSWSFESTEYGTVKADVFASHDGRFQYMFCTDKMGRSWIATIDTRGKIGSTGLRQNWVDAGSLTTPPMEYASQTGGYGNYDLQEGDYVDMFKNYLSKVPVIKKFRYLKQK